MLQTFSHPCTPSLFGTRHLLECTSIFEIIIPHWNRIIKQLEYVCAVPNTMGRGQSPGDMHACMHKWLSSSRKKMIVAMWSCAEGCSVISRLTLASCSEPATLRGVHTLGTSVTSTGTSIKKSAWFWMLTYSRRGRCSSLRIASRICCRFDCAAVTSRRHLSQTTQNGLCYLLLQFCHFLGLDLSVRCNPRVWSDCKPAGLLVIGSQ